MPDQASLHRPQSQQCAADTAINIAKPLLRHCSHCMLQCIAKIALMPMLKEKKEDSRQFGAITGASVSRRSTRHAAAPML